MEDALRDCYIMRLLLAYRITGAPSQRRFSQLVCSINLSASVPLTLNARSLSEIGNVMLQNVVKKKNAQLYKESLLNVLDVQQNYIHIYQSNLKILSLDHFCSFS
jgi:hypothetical protein